SLGSPPWGEDWVWQDGIGLLVGTTKAAAGTKRANCSHATLKNAVFASRDAPGRTSTKRSSEFTHARGSQLVRPGRCSCQAKRANAAGEPERRGAEPGRKGPAGARSYAAAGEWRGIEDRAGADSGGV